MAVVRVICQSCTRRIGPGYDEDELWLLPEAPPGQRRVCRSCADWSELDPVLLVTRDELARYGGLALLELIKTRERDILGMPSRRSVRRSLATFVWRPAPSTRHWAALARTV